MGSTALQYARPVRCYPNGEKLKPSEKLVLMLLADHCNETDGQINPSLSTLVEETGLTRQGVINALATLQKHGIVEAEHRQREGKAVAAVNLYRLPLMTKVVKSVDYPKEETEVEVVKSLDYGSQVTLLGVVKSVDYGSQVSGLLEAKLKPKVEAKEKRVRATAAAAPTTAKKSKAVKPEKTDAQKATNEIIRRLRFLFWEHFAPMAGKDAEWMGRNLSKVLESYPEDDIAGTLRAIAAKYPDAKTKGQTLSFLNLSLWVEEWQDAGRPGVFPGAVFLHLPGVNNGNATSGHLAASKTIADAGRFDPWKDKYGPRGTSNVSLTAHRDAG